MILINFYSKIESNVKRNSLRCEASSKFGVRMSCFLTHIVKLLVLNVRAYDAEDHDCDEVSIEPWVYVRSCTRLDLLNEFKFIRESSSIKRNTPPDSISTNECCSVDDHVVVDYKAEDCSNNCACYGDAPEQNFALSLVEDCFVKQKAKTEATPAGKNCCSNSLHSCHNESDYKADNN